MTQLTGDKSRVERMLNHRHLLDMFLNSEYEPTKEILLHLMQTLKEIWSCKLLRDFPDRQITVETYGAGSDDFLAWEISFFQERSSTSGSKT
jgi:hypothetical protein